VTVTYKNLTVDWYGYATVRLEADGTVVYLDPGRYGVLTGEWEADSEAAAGAHPPGRDRHPGDADAVCVTHVHPYVPDGIGRVANGGTAVRAVDGINRDDTSRDVDRVAELDYGTGTVGMEDEGAVGDVFYWTVPAYNDPESDRRRADGSLYHPRGFGCGFLLSVGGVRVFWTGDTDVLEGHAALDVDVFLPPIGGTVTMDRTEAAALAAEMDPELVVPVHYNTFGALETDSAAFRADLEAAGVPIELDEE
jgi:L-ascorbate metabolism protein UlaG (beta-lactamase superfamily)